jgi:hypothetical protein
MSGKGVLGIAAGVVLLLVIAYYAIPNPGKKALQGEEIALEDVSSWRISTYVSRDGRPLMSRVHAASCPNKEHIIETAMLDFAEYIRIGDDIYYRKDSYTWVKGTPGPDLFAPLPTPRPCLTEHAGTGRSRGNAAGTGDGHQGWEYCKRRVEGQCGQPVPGVERNAVYGDKQAWKLYDVPERNRPSAEIHPGGKR